MHQRVPRSVAILLSPAGVPRNSRPRLRKDCVELLGLPRKRAEPSRALTVSARSTTVQEDMHASVGRNFFDDYAGGLGARAKSSVSPGRPEGFEESPDAGLGNVLRPLWRSRNCLRPATHMRATRRIVL